MQIRSSSNTQQSVAPLRRSYSSSSSSVCQQQQQQYDRYEKAPAKAPEKARYSSSEEIAPKTLPERIAAALGRLNEARRTREELVEALADGMLMLSDSELCRIAQAEILSQGVERPPQLFVRCWLDASLGIMFKGASGQLCSLRYGEIPTTEAWRYTNPDRDGYDSSRSSSPVGSRTGRHAVSHSANNPPAPPPYVMTELSKADQRAFFVRNADARSLVSYGDSADELLARAVRQLEDAAT